MSSNIAKQCQGRWHQILSDYIDPSYLDGKHHPCPCGDGKDRFRFSDHGGAGRYFCACSEGNNSGFDLLACVTGKSFAQVCQMLRDDGHVTDEGKPEPKPRLPWADLKQVRESMYLTSRGLETPRSLLFGMVEDGGERWPAMIADVLARDGSRIGRHLTFLRKDGQIGKRQGDTPRKLFGSPLAGGAVRLYPAKDRVGVAEGIETAIAAKQLFGIPTWACLNTALLGSFDPPEGITEVVIFADHDEHYAGHAAAYKLAHRLAKKGYTVQVEVPPKAGDWNDVLLDEMDQGVAA